MGVESFKPINIREVVRDKSPKVAKLLPGFVYRYIHRIIHVDYINEFMKELGHLEGIEFVRSVIKYFEVKKNVIGIENVPAGGKYIFASNHPLGGFDGMVLMDIIDSNWGSMKALSNDILMNMSNMKSVFVPVNKHGSFAREAAEILNEAYLSENQIMVFPAGLASRKIKGKIIDLDWKKHFIAKSVEFQRDVVPVFIDGRNSNWFYTVAKLRKLLRIKWNLEMFYLPDETYKHRKKTVTVRFGKPLPYTSFDKSKTHKEWADYVKALVYKLPDGGEAGN
jgi:1-acyl-sn-glycerol-3-phosphate acyltransferase